MDDLSLTLKQLSALSQETRLLTFRALMEAGAEGMQAGLIAGKLGLSPKTVHAMRNRAMAKLNVHSVAELTKYAIRVGLTTLDE